MIGKALAASVYWTGFVVICIAKAIATGAVWLLLGIFYTLGALVVGIMWTLKVILEVAAGGCMILADVAAELVQLILWGKPPPQSL